jgi:hypothetical protein
VPAAQAHTSTSTLLLIAVQPAPVAVAKCHVYSAALSSHPALPACCCSAALLLLLASPSQEQRNILAIAAGLRGIAVIHAVLN